MNIKKLIEIKCFNFLIRLFNYGKISKYNLISLGTEYGKWTVPQPLINESTSCILVGAGEDISFDLELLHNFECRLVICDPTTRSKLHIESFLSRGSYEFTDFRGQKKKLEFRSETLKNKFLFINEGIHAKSGLLEFYLPMKQNHVSFSIYPNLNNVQSNNSVKLKVLSLTDLITANSIINIQLIKLDIEGAEYDVIDNFEFNSIPELKILCIEFHKIKKFYFIQLIKYCFLLYSKGFKPVYFQDMFNVIFFKR
jgi:FkbM family methyltransferase